VRAFWQFVGACWALGLICLGIPGFALARTAASVRFSWDVSTINVDGTGSQTQHAVVAGGAYRVCHALVYNVDPSWSWTGLDSTTMLVHISHAGQESSEKNGITGESSGRNSYVIEPAGNAGENGGASAITPLEHHEDGLYKIALAVRGKTIGTSAISITSCPN
jgi:hypothetical protein